MRHLRSASTRVRLGQGTFTRLSLYFCIDNLALKLAPGGGFESWPWHLHFTFLSGSRALTRASISPPSASKKLLSTHSPERKHTSGLPILVVGFGQEPRPIPPSPWRHVQGTRCVPACSTGTEVVSGIGVAWEVFNVTPQNLFVVQSSSRPSLRVLQDVLRA